MYPAREVALEVLDRKCRDSANDVSTYLNDSIADWC